MLTEKLMEAVTNNLLHRILREKFDRLGLCRPMRIERYEAEDELSYDVESLESQNAKVTVSIEKFIGGGFAGQVYKVRVKNIESDDGFSSLEVDKSYAMKVLIPPSRGALLFRNILYWIGFQAPFQLQVNPSAAKSGALWQKFIRRAAGVRFGNENTVNDIHAVFVDHRLGSCGELSDWVEGRTWRLEVDDRMDILKRWCRDKTIDTEQLGSIEYRAKKTFMRDFVKLLHDVGAHEFARQYEWSTCKSQPNCLKRTDTEADPEAGLTAVDFRAGLVLLPFLPMSPGDFKLIWQGLKRGSIVQFDRGDIAKLEKFINEHREGFSGCEGMLEELKLKDAEYRNSVPDITHNHFRLLYSVKLWSTIFSSAVTSWRTRNLISAGWENKFRGSQFLTLIFFVIGLVPFLGGFIRKIWALPDWRRHYLYIVTDFSYFRRAMRGRITEKLLSWQRKGRISGESAKRISEENWRFFCHLPFLLLILPGLHRFLTDWQFFKGKLHYIFVRPIKLYFNPHLREQWLRDMVEQGKQKHILTDEDAETILCKINEPYIQKYLKSLAVHVCTLPVTQVVSLAIAAIFLLKHPEFTWKQALAAAGGILFLFQVIPISPGSLVRGFYVVYLVKKEKDFKNYNIAVFLSFFKYIGYLAFPIQMSYRYPALARFMAGHWATEAVHFVPVFGERGALLEHWVFCLFYNRPLTIRRKIVSRAELRKKLKPRYWQIVPSAIIAGCVLGGFDYLHMSVLGTAPSLRDILPVAIVIPAVTGMVVTIAAGGTVLWKRIISAVVAGCLTAVLYSCLSSVITHQMPANIVWRIFAFTVFSTVGAILTELMLPDPDLE